MSKQLPEENNKSTHIALRVKKLVLVSSLLVLIIIITVVFSFALGRRHETLVVEEIERIGGAVAFESTLPAGLQRWLGSPFILKWEDVIKRARGLELSETRIDRRLLERIGRMTDLKIISLYGTNVSNSDLEHLKGLKNLETLVLQKTEVSDQGLAHLKSLKNLRQLFVLETRVTDTGVTELKSALPKVPVFK